jgi:hypothetical protein
MGPPSIFILQPRRLARSEKPRLNSHEFSCLAQQFRHIRPQSLTDDPLLRRQLRQRLGVAQAGMPRTADRAWTYARVFLLAELKKGQE